MPVSRSIIIGAAAGAVAVVAVVVVVVAQPRSHDVAWWQAHPDALQRQITKCQNNPGRLAQTTDCMNAGKAVADYMFNAHNKGALKIMPTPSSGDSALELPETGPEKNVGQKVLDNWSKSHPSNQ